ncbi:motility associated factor glycosyltransferase family protein [Thermaerobacillus caldiproteolyticus]|uniref:motility associated factor glycosyltransferase family protein n=1 Tax=Thermaerobacillus caldiproteolyticus TaxID=247480 RepID=UPI00188A11E3|nr:6-hydroxymethylpterin diphosphokinase MptE-like protein [Anoxybacillus caldiproteolyticus]QPA30709.1 motility associated factor glycosyltransferase family protein [Anoxybacillus caldiproteolyticus]
MSILSYNLASLKNKQLRERLLRPIKESINIDIHLSKKGPLTMKLNGHYLYSRYDPLKDAERFIHSQIDGSASVYCLFGFGLGYHVQELLQKEPDKQIVVIEPYVSVIRKAAENIDLSNIFSHPNVDILCLEQGQTMINALNELAKQQTRWIIPNAWLKSLPQDHPFKHFLEDIKIREMSFQRFSSLMEKNFAENLKYMDADVGKLFAKFNGQKAILVSAGPSLDDTVYSLKKLKGKYFILSVGSALRVLKENDIVPDAVIITDPQETVYKQLDGMEFAQPLIYLSTACHSAVANHRGLKVLAFQKGYPKAESYAGQYDLPLVDTGGSVATTALDILIKMGFSEIVLLGQDLAYSKNRSHALQSTSGVEVVSNESLFPFPANDGTMVKTTTILSIYRRWFERKVAETKHVIFKNTAEKGAVIQGVPFVHISEIISESEHLIECNFSEKINRIINQ